MAQSEALKDIRNVDAWAKQIQFWRTHLDIFIEDVLGVKLKDVQKVIARSFGNCEDVMVVKSRGFGKTWLIALCCLAMGILYPGSHIAVVSGTANQATHVLKKIDDEFSKNPNIIKEILASGHNPVQLNQNKGRCRLKNGSSIETYSIQTMRGVRAKIIVVDEAPEVKKEDLDAIVKPVRNTTRSVCLQHGITDYNSKMVSMTSACLKSNYFYDLFVECARRMGGGDKSSFCCALDYNAAIRCGISSEEFFLSERKTLPESKFAMEYGSIFVGAEAGSVFPYDLTEACRTLRSVETIMPKGSLSKYVMGVDLATSNSKAADNAVICVIKLVERKDGTYNKQQVYMRSFHGKRLDVLANEVRKILVKFPNIIRVVFDHRGLGDAFPQFLSQPWTDPESGKEYPPLVLDEERSLIHNASPILRSIKGNVSINQQMVTGLRVALEQHSIQLPVSSRMIINGRIADDEELEDSEAMDDEEVEKKKGTTGKFKTLNTFEKFIFIETDALQVEMGNIVAKVSNTGTYLYDTAKTTQHKDRYSSMAMAIHYISELEDARKKEIAYKSNLGCIGIVTTIR